MGLGPVHGMDFEVRERLMGPFCTPPLIPPWAMLPLALRVLRRICQARARPCWLGSPGGLGRCWPESEACKESGDLQGWLPSEDLRYWLLFVPLSQNHPGMEFHPEGAVSRTLVTPGASQEAPLAEHWLDSSWENGRTGAVVSGALPDSKTLGAVTN
jgi:hypothetical protein